MPTFPVCWNWDLVFSEHAKLRMEQRGATEMKVRAILKRATSFNKSVVEGRFMLRSRRRERPWIVIVEPDIELEQLVVVTAY